MALIKKTFLDRIRFERDSLKNSELAERFREATAQSSRSPIELNLSQ